jgi:hypothetical protein
MARKARIIAPPQDLKRRAVNFRKGLDLNLSQQDIERIQSVIDESRDKCASEVADQLSFMQRGLPEAQSDKRERPAFLRIVRSSSLDVKGLGGMFGFPLLTAFAKSLNDFVTPLRDANNAQMAVIHTHIDAMYVVLMQRITGTGGTVEGQVLDAFKTATKKFK